mgnify:CR=1 FL=1
MTNTGFRYLGNRVTEPIKELDTFRAPFGLSRVVFESDELTSRCPVTSQPDFYHIYIEYTPRELCIESKSLKLYLMSFRETAQFAEVLAVEIAEHLQNTIIAKRIHVELRQQVRGGLQLTASAGFHLEGE